MPLLFRKAKSSRDSASSWHLHYYYERRKRTKKGLLLS